MRSCILLFVSFCFGVFVSAVAAQDLSLPSTPAKAVTTASNPFGLKPGEILLSVDGVPVQVCPNGKCSLQRGTPVRDAAAGAVEGFSDGLLQMKANAMARRLAVFHASGGYVSGARYEGVGSGNSPQAAISNCCFYGRRAIVASAVAQGSNGRWYAVVQYR